MKQSMVQKLTCIRVSDSKIAMGSSVCNEFQVFNAVSVTEYIITWPKGVDTNTY